MRNFGAGEGGTCLRNPFDLAKGTARYSEAEWRDVNLIQSKG
jgi:hypothetical protein